MIRPQQDLFMTAGVSGIISRADLETLRDLARNLRHIRLAALSTGGAVSFILSTESWIPAILFRDDPGCTRTLKMTPRYVGGCLKLPFGLFSNPPEADYNRNVYTTLFKTFRLGIRGCSKKRLYN